MNSIQWASSEDFPWNQLKFEEEIWLQYPQSLTAKIHEWTSGAFTLEVCHEGWAEDGMHWLRNILFRVEGQPWILAQSEISHELVKALPNIIQLGNTPLGDFLFKNNFVRSNFEFAKIDNDANLIAPVTLARRSIFKNEQGSLLVTEFFCRLFFEKMTYVTK